jgi:hypothetical protein
MSKHCANCGATVLAVKRPRSKRKRKPVSHVADVMLLLIGQTTVITAYALGLNWGAR